MNQRKFTGKTAEFIQKGRNSSGNQGSKSSWGIGKVLSDKMDSMQRKLLIKTVSDYGKERFAFGSFFTVVFSLGTLFSLLDGGDVGGTLVNVLFAGGAASQCFVGYGQRKTSARMVKSLQVIGNSPNFSMKKLSQLTNESEQDLCDDFDLLIGKGILKEGFLDRRHGTLVLSDVETYVAHYPEEEIFSVETEIAEEAMPQLQALKEVNRSIVHEGVSGQIDQIVVTTGKILAWQGENPEKERQLHRFLSYYLPTTLKLLQSYAQLESQQIEGAYISDGKAKIEGLMVKMVRGFEHQLDQLFQEETMDISADITVLEQMMKMDGLSGGVLDLKEFQKEYQKKGNDLKF